MAEKKEKKIGPKARAEMTNEEPKTKKTEKKSEKPQHKTTVIEHHGRGKGHTVRHSPGTPQEESYAAPDLNAVSAGLQQNVGESDQGDQEAPPQVPPQAPPTAPPPQM